MEGTNEFHAAAYRPVEKRVGADGEAAQPRPQFWSRGSGAGEVGESGFPEATNWGSSPTPSSSAFCKIRFGLATTYGLTHHSRHIPSPRYRLSSFNHPCTGKPVIRPSGLDSR